MVGKPFGKQKMRLNDIVTLALEELYYENWRLIEPALCHVKWYACIQVLAGWNFRIILPKMWSVS
jgi:hypothetical protein